MVSTNLQLAGMTNGEGEVAARIPPGVVIIPGSVELEGGSLVWHISPDALKHPRVIQPADSLLDSFIRLADAPPESLLRFARKHGVLGFDGNYYPAREIMQGCEPIDRWRRWSTTARSVLNVAAALQQNKPGALADWENIIPLYRRFPDHRFPPRTPAQARAQLQHEVNGWLKLGRVSFCLGWEKPRTRWRTEIDFGGFMFSVLALQLMLAVAGSDLFICSGCNLPYGRPKEKKRPKKGWGNFCEVCGITAALRQADRRRKEKMSEARRLHAQGVSPREIAAQLDTTAASVRRWLKR